MKNDTSIRCVSKIATIDNKIWIGYWKGSEFISIQYNSKKESDQAYKDLKKQEV